MNNESNEKELSQETEAELKGYLDEADEHFYKKYGVHIYDALDDEDQIVVGKVLRKIIHLNNNILMDSICDTLLERIKEKLIKKCGGAA